MTQAKAIDINAGKAMVITDLHGEGVIYGHLRDKFMALREKGEVDRLIICGDLIHGYQEESDDASLSIILDMMKLQQTLGADKVILLMGNHEVPHVYDVVLSKGHMLFTPRFERALVWLDKSDEYNLCREDVINFLKSLPFIVRTKAGVLISHAGATPAIKSKADAEQLVNFDHDKLLAQGNEWIADYDLNALKHNADYRFQVHQNMSIDNPDDPRYTGLLRGTLISSNSGQFQFLWDVMFATNEMGWNIGSYEVVLQAYLNAISQVSPFPQKVIVSGHISVKGGHELITPYQLRLATYAHAHPVTEGEYLILDCETPVEKAENLVPALRKTMD